MIKKNAIMWLMLPLLMGACGHKEKKTAQGTVAPVPVVTMVAGGGQSLPGRTYSGTIEEESGTALSFATMGTVLSLNVDEGQTVARGQLIGVLDATAARSAHEAAEAAKEQALDAQRRMKLLHDAGSLPEIKWVETLTQVRQAEAQEQIARKSLADTRLYAPSAGYVVQKLVEPGANVGPGVPVVRLVQIGSVKVKINVPEEEVSSMPLGTPLRVQVAALGGRTYSARVTEKNVAGDALSRSYDVKALIPNPSHALLPGMIAEVTVQAGGRAAAEASAAIVLPADAIEIDEGNRAFVWTVQGGKACQTWVTTGENLPQGVAVTGGLAPGDEVIVRGQQKVSQGMAVTATRQ